MTAVPATYGAGVQLICDGCGEVADSGGCGLHDADVVYVAVTAVGWTGSPFARGPHRCRNCSSKAMPPRRRTDRSSRAGAVFDRVALELMSSAAVVHVIGDLDSDTAAELRPVLEAATAARRTVVVELGRAGVIDSLGLGTLVRARNAARRRQAELVLAGPSMFVRTVLRTMRLHTAFRIFATVEQAVAATRQPHRCASQAPLLHSRIRAER